MDAPSLKFDPGAPGSGTTNVKKKKKFWLFAMFPIVLLMLLSFLDCDLCLFLSKNPKLEEQSYKNKVVWVLGASSGIGESLAEDLAAHGAQVVISARRVEKLEAIVTNCKAKGYSTKDNQPFVLPLDVTDTEAQGVAYQALIDRFGRVDVLVLNPGQSQRNLALETSDEQTRSLFELNFFSYISLAKMVAADMTTGGQIVVTSSISGKIGTPLGSTYSATKFALHGYFDAFRAENYAKGIKVLLVCPGPVESEIFVKSLRNDDVVLGVEEGKMKTKRCTELVVRAMHNDFDEVWIAKQPILAVTNLHVYAPFWSRQLFKRMVGPNRARMLKSGGDAYDFWQNLGFQKSNPL